MRRLTLFAFLPALVLTLNTGRTIAQEGGENKLEARAPALTAAAAGERVRFTAPSDVVRMQVQVFSESGDALLDVSSKGNVFDWTLRDGGGRRVNDGEFLCVVTVKSLSGRISQRVGTVSVRGAVVTLLAEAARLTAAQREAVGPVGDDAALTILGESDARAATVATHDGRDGQLTATAGALTFRTGDVFAGNDKEHMRVTEEGRVGIGNRDPQAALDVAGAVRASGGFTFKDGTTLSSEGGRLTLTSESGDELPGPSSAAGTGTVNRLAKWSETGGAGTLADAAGAESGGLTFFGQNASGQVAPLFASAPTFHVLEVAAPGTKTPLTLAGGSGVMEFWKDLGGGVGGPAAAVSFGMAKPGTAASNDMVFSTYTSSVGWNERMRLTSDGNLGVGTGSPVSRLDVNGAGRFTPGGSGGVIQLGSPNSETGLSISNASTRADLRFDGTSVRLLAGSAGGPPPGTSGVSVNTLGNVGIGTSNPPIAKLHVLTATAGLPGLYAESQNRGVWGVSTGSSYGLYGESVNGIGAQGVSTSNIGVGGISSTNIAVAGTSGSNIGVRGQTGSTSVAAPGVQGVSTGAGGVGVRGDGTTGVYGVSTGGVGVTGEANAGGSTGVYGTSTSGYAVYANGNAGQALSKGGFVKAMLYVNPTLPAEQYIVRCYNGLTNSSAGNCGFTVTRNDVGEYTVNFGTGFNVSDRFFSITTNTGYTGGNVSPHLSTTTVFVTTWVPYGNEGGFVPFDAGFYLIVY